MDETLESINRQLEENQWQITRLNPSPAYYVVSSPLRAGEGVIKAYEWTDRGNGLEPSHPAQIPVPEVPTPISETEDGFVLNYKPGALYGGLVHGPGATRFRYGFGDRRG